MFRNVRFYGFASFCESLLKEGMGKKEGSRIKNLLKSGYSFGDLLKSYPSLGYGIEYIKFVRKNGTEKRIGYINVGDTYIPTLIRFRGNVRFTTVGDVVEMMERSGWSVE